MRVDELKIGCVFKIESYPGSLFERVSNDRSSNVSRIHAICIGGPNIGLDIHLKADTEVDNEISTLPDGWIDFVDDKDVYEFESNEIVEEDLNSLPNDPEWNEKEGGEESNKQKQFCRDMKRADRKVSFYCGRFFYKGLATTVDSFDEIQSIIRATDVLLQWDQLGKEGYIIYPK